MSDGSLDCQRKEGRRKVSADRNYSVEVVSPICQYGDIETVQELIRKLREAGAFVNSSCGIHIHINAAPFDAPHLRNLVNIMRWSDCGFVTAGVVEIYENVSKQRNLHGHLIGGPPRKVGFHMR